MPRPDSKIMQTATDDGDASNAETLISKSRAKRVAVQSGSNIVPIKVAAKPTAEDKAAAKQAAIDAKAKLVQQKADLKAALAQARAPLDEVEASIKAAEKAAVDVQRIYDRAAADRDKAIKANTKLQDTLTAKKAKFTAAFDKAKAKIDAQLAKLG